MIAPAEIGNHAKAHARWHWGEFAFWIAALACAFLFPSRYLIMTDIVRLALFALSLDLILGYAGIVSLGHAAFFGIGAYCAGLLALQASAYKEVEAYPLDVLGAQIADRRAVMRGDRFDPGVERGDVVSRGLRRDQRCEGCNADVAKPHEFTEV